MIDQYQQTVAFLIDIYLLTSGTVLLFMLFDLIDFICDGAELDQDDTISEVVFLTFVYFIGAWIPVYNIFLLQQTKSFQLIKSNHEAH